MTKDKSKTTKKGFKFPKGNELYKIRSTNGRSAIYETPEEIQKKANEYFEYVLNNPIKEEVLINKSYQKRTKKGDKDIIKTKSHSKAKLNKLRPFTLWGLCNYMDIGLTTFRNYEKKPDFMDIISRIRQIIDMQQFEGGVTGQFNSSLIARRLNLIDRTDVTSGDQPLRPTTSEEDIDNRIDKLLAKRRGEAEED